MLQLREGTGTLGRGERLLPEPSGRPENPACADHSNRHLRPTWSPFSLRAKINLFSILAEKVFASGSEERKVESLRGATGRPGLTVTGGEVNQTTGKM